MENYATWLKSDSAFHNLTILHKAHLATDWDKLVCKVVALMVMCASVCNAKKRILLEDNYYNIVQRLNALENVSHVLEANSRALESKVAEPSRHSHVP